MPTIFTHAAVPLAFGLGIGRGKISGRLLAVGIAASIVPDLDVIAFRFNVAYADTFGHRGASHSLLFALIIGLLAAGFAKHLKSTRRMTFLFAAMSVASHGLLDTFTNGGKGVALWWPFSGERLFSPWQVIEVSPLSLRRMFSERGLEVIQSELIWVWLPAALICTLLVVLRRRYLNMSLDSGASRKST